MTTRLSRKIDKKSFRFLLPMRNYMRLLRDADKARVSICIVLNRIIDNHYRANDCPKTRNGATTDSVQ